MQVIRFRAWDNASKEWLLGYNFGSLGGFNLFGEVVVFGEWGNLADQYIFERNGHKIADLKVMQFVGVKDLKGKDIYEGDIVRHGSLVAAVIFDAPQFRAGIHSKVNMVHDILNGECEVIGNIYENPELLNASR